MTIDNSKVRYCGGRTAVRVKAITDKLADWERWRYATLPTLVVWRPTLRSFDPALEKQGRADDAGQSRCSCVVVV